MKDKASYEHLQAPSHPAVKVSIPHKFLKITHGSKKYLTGSNTPLQKIGSQVQVPSLKLSSIFSFQKEGSTVYNGSCQRRELKVLIRQSKTAVIGFSYYKFSECYGQIKLE